MELKPKAMLIRLGATGLCALAVIGCQSGRSGPVATTSADAPKVVKSPARRSANQPDQIRRVVCLYDYKPWLNIDTAGDEDPEGIHFRVFLDPGTGRGEPRDGMFHIEMYRIDRLSGGQIDRTMISDWHYSTRDFQQVESSLLGMGYHLRLRWATKELAGREVEVITSFENLTGHKVRSGTKRLRVPKYSF